MSTEQILRISSTSSATTESIAEEMGKHLKGLEVIELVSDLGGGKTTFVRGLVRGAGSNDHVSSPTFAVSNVYKSTDIEIHHFDFYRLSEPGLIENEVSEIMHDPRVVVVVEWSDIIKHILPKERITIYLKSDDSNNRELRIRYPKKLAYVMKDLV